MSDHSYSVTPTLSLDFTLLRQQIKLLQEMHKKARGMYRDRLEGVIFLLQEIQEHAASEHDEETVFGTFLCSSCDERTNDGHAHHGAFYCEECWDPRLKVTG